MPRCRKFSTADAGSGSPWPSSASSARPSRQPAPAAVDLVELLPSSSRSMSSPQRLMRRASRSRAQAQHRQAAPVGLASQRAPAGRPQSVFGSTRPCQGDRPPMARISGNRRRPAARPRAAAQEAVAGQGRHSDAATGSCGLPDCAGTRRRRPARAPPRVPASIQAITGRRLASRCRRAGSTKCGDR